MPRPPLWPTWSRRRRRAAYRRAGLWTDESLPDTVRGFAAQSPEKVAIVDLEGERHVTYAELARDATTVEAALVELGVQPGDVVTVQLPNWYETVAVGLGVIAAGAVLNPVLPDYRGNELRVVLDVARSKVLFTPDMYRGFDHAAMVADLGAKIARSPGTRRPREPGGTT